MCCIEPEQKMYSQQKSLYPASLLTLPGMARSSPSHLLIISYIGFSPWLYLPFYYFLKKGFFQVHFLLFLAPLTTRVYYDHTGFNQAV
jgi:hypothetical protein